ncbi:MAG: T9SS type A sorting domain-containing protein [Bacteroidota bacterium]
MKYSALLTLLLLAFTQLPAQSFIKHKALGTDYNAGLFSQFADIDQDGWQDVLVFNSDFNLLWYRNSGEDACYEENFIASFTDTIAVTSADMNNDGLLDLVVARVGTNGPEMVLFLKTGNVQYSQQVLDYNLEMVPNEVFIEDMDNDGLLDIVSFTEHYIFGLFNQGNAQFTAHLIAEETAPGFFSDIDIADRNQDNLLDVIGISRPPELFNKFVYWYDQGANFQFTRNLVQRMGSTEARGIVVVDTDNDGDLDIVVGENSLSGGVILIKNESFPLPWPYSRDIFTGYVEDLVPIDLDQDGDIDFVFRDLNGPTSSPYYLPGWLRNNGGDQFEYVQLDSYKCSPFHIGDFNNDGHWDITHISYEGSLFDQAMIVVKLNDGQQNFGEVYLDTDNSSTSLVDINQDSLFEMFSASNRGYILHTSCAPFRYSSEKMVYPNLSGGMDWVDYNKDGFMDIIPPPTNNTISVYLNDGFNNFVDKTPLFVHDDGSARYLLVMDANGDGLEDFIVSNRDRIFTYINNGNDEFSKIAGGSLDNGIVFTKSQVIDFERDGDLDLLIERDNRIYLFKNNGEGAFIRHSFAPWFQNSLSRVKIDHLNGDSLPDLVIRANDASLIINYGIGNDEYRQVKLIDSLNRWQKNLLLTGDFDLDGDIDFIYTDIKTYLGPSDYSVIWYENLGQDEFSPHVIEENIYLLGYVRSIDFDFDGDLDICIGKSESQELYIYENTLNAKTLRGVVYFDENENGQKDAEESGVGNIGLFFNDQNRYVSDFSGNYSIPVFHGSNYDIRFAGLSNWRLTTADSIYQIQVDSQSLLQSYDFGLAPLARQDSVQVFASNYNARCGVFDHYFLSIENLGTTFISGILWAKTDALLQEIEFPNPPDTTDGTWVGWKLADLPPFQTARQRIRAKIPVMGWTLGDSLNTAVRFISTNQDTTEFNLSNLIRCSYDPNDKLVHPDRQGTENYTLFEEELLYTIRFQNTGNDTAFKVVIRDTLDDQLDLSTFRVINSSHLSLLQTILNDNNDVVFTFEDINLLDSASSWEGSQGFVSYAIRPLAGLPENTEITNTAAIYFDFNPPIITNTTVNTLVSELPMVNSTTGRPPSDRQLQAFPNPADDYLHLRLRGNDDRWTLEVFNHLGQSLQPAATFQRQERLDTRHWPPGLYLIRLRHNGQIISQKVLIL